MVIQHNITAMNSQRMLGVVTGLQAKSSEKLSSGYKINRAADDAAGLSISEKMRRQIRGLTQASANAQDGISLVRVSDGAMNEISDMLQRCNELAVKSSNGTLTSSDRSYIQAEMEAITSEIDRVSSVTTFNEIPVLQGNYEVSEGLGFHGELPTSVTSASLSFAAKHAVDQLPSSIGLNGGKTSYGLKVDLSGVEDVEDLYNTGFALTCGGCSNYSSVLLTEGTTSSFTNSGSYFTFNIGIGDCANGTEVADKITKTITGTTAGGVAANESGGLSGVNATHAHQYFFITNEGNGLMYLYDGRGGGDTTTGTASSQSDYNVGNGVYCNSKSVTSSDVTLNLQVGSEQGNTLEIRLANMSSVAMGLQKYKYDYLNQIDYGFVNTADLSTQAAAQKSIKVFKKAMAYVSEERSRMGAYENRLEHTIKNLDNVIENTTSAESEIRDTDMSSEMVKYSNNNVLAQAGQSMLAQANKNNQGILSLLQ